MRRWMWLVAGLVCCTFTSLALVGCGQTAPDTNLTEEEAEDMSMQMSGMYSSEGDELGEEAEPDLGTPGYEEESEDY